MKGKPNENNKNQSKEQKNKKEVDHDIKQQQTDFLEEQKQQESVLQDTGSSRKIFKLGIHIADLSQSIKKETRLYNNLDQRVQSIYVPLGKTKTLSRICQTKSLFNYFHQRLEKRSRQKVYLSAQNWTKITNFTFHWDSLRLEDTVIECKQKYYYEESDSYLKVNKQSISELYKDDEEVTSSDDDEEKDDGQEDGVGNKIREKNPKNENLILTNEEFLTFFQLGGQLFLQRLKKGLNAFQEEFTEKIDIYHQNLLKNQ
ncbi:hypothetical protein ABPG72_003256 [Tetrahymena utriculariae]